MGFFAGIETAKAAGGALYLQPGTYELKVLECKIGKSPKDGRQYCVVEYEVLAAAPGSTHAPGDRPSHLIMMSGLNWLGDVKAMVAAIMSIPTAAVDEPGVEMFFGPKQPGKGKLVRARAWNHTTRQNRPFTKIVYEAAPKS